MLETSDQAPSVWGSRARASEGEGVNAGGPLAAFDRLAIARAAGSHIPAVRAVFDDIARWLHDRLHGGQQWPLHMYLGLPKTPAATKLYLRDQWLSTAASLLEWQSAYDGAGVLADEWAKFVTRGGWDAQSEACEPPAELTSRLRRALWWATRYNDGDVLSRSQLYGIWSEKLKPTPGMLHSQARIALQDREDH